MDARLGAIPVTETRRSAQYAGFIIHECSVSASRKNTTFPEGRTHIRLNSTSIVNMSASTVTGYVFDLSLQQAKAYNYLANGTYFHRVSWNGTTYHILTGKDSEELETVMRLLCELLMEAPKTLVTIHNSSTPVSY
jgi:hypothetical protein